MKKVIFICLLCVGLFVGGVSALSVVTLEDNQGILDLIYSSSESVEVSAFEILLQCDSDISITEIKGVSPYEVFNGTSDEKGFVTIAGYTTILPEKNQNTLFAKIFTTGSGSIHVVGVELEDFNRQKIDLDNSGIYSVVTQTSPPPPTAVSASPTQVVTQTTTVPTSEPTQNVEPLQTSTPVPTGQVPLSNNPTPTSTKTPFELFPVIIGLTAVIFKLRRAND